MWLILPRMLKDVSRRNLKKTVLGKPVKFPIGFSPAGFQGLAHPDGEIAAAKAAAALGTIFALSTYASKSIEEIAEAVPNGRKWFQLFPNSDRDVSVDMMKRAENAGFEAIIVTLDAQNFGNKRRTARSGLYIPPHLRLGNLAKYSMTAKNASPEKHSKTDPTSSSSSEDEDVNDIADHVHRTLAQDLTWNTISHLRKHTKLPLILKGILRPEDAASAVKFGVDGIWVSNHGGRQVDTAPQPIDVLADIVKVVNNKCEIYIDSGIRKGSDVFKALALGATMAFLGRPQIWGAAVGGEDGVKKVLHIIKEELDLTLALSGVANVNDITKDYVLRVDQFAKL